MNAYAKPVPEPTLDSQPYWDGLREHRLVIQRCARCGHFRHYPRPVCDRCYSMEVQWVEASRRGTVHSWTVTHHAFHPGFKGDLPYALVTVDLEEGVRLQCRLRPTETAALRLGLPVRIEFDDVTDALTLPVAVVA